MNILWNTGCYKSMADHMDEQEEKMFTPMERLIMKQLTEFTQKLFEQIDWKKIDEMTLW